MGRDRQTDRQRNEEKSRKEEMSARIQNQNDNILYLRVRACLLEDSVETENVNTGSYCAGCNFDGARTRSVRI